MAVPRGGRAPQRARAEGVSCPPARQVRGGIRKAIVHDTLGHPGQAAWVPGPRPRAGGAPGLPRGGRPVPSVRMPPGQGVRGSDAVRDAVLLWDALVRGAAARRQRGRPRDRAHRHQGPRGLARQDDLHGRRHAARPRGLRRRGRDHAPGPNAALPQPRGRLLLEARAEPVVPPVLGSASRGRACQGQPAPRPRPRARPRRDQAGRVGQGRRGHRGDVPLPQRVPRTCELLRHQLLPEDVGIVLPRARQAHGSRQLVGSPGGGAPWRGGAGRRGPAGCSRRPPGSTCPRVGRRATRRSDPVDSRSSSSQHGAARSGGSGSTR